MRNDLALEMMFNHCDRTTQSGAFRDMGNAIWLSFSLPVWFFSMAANPLSGGLLTGVPAFGILCLVAGLILMLVKRAWEMFWFLVPVVGSQVLVSIAGLMRGQLVSGSGAPIIAFLILELGACIFILIRCRRHLLPAVPLAIFVMTYALFAGFLGTMSLSDNWL